MEERLVEPAGRVTTPENTLEIIYPKTLRTGFF
jgi:hypothetical protein